MSANLPASVLSRLLALSRQNGWDYQEVLARYATERFLARLAVSRWANKFVLKGGNMFIVWLGGYDYRPTMDTDFLWRGRGDSLAVESAFREIAETDLPEDDAIRFDPATLKIAQIRVQTRYGGNEATLLAKIGKTRIPLHFDIGFGDRVWPAIRDEQFPALLAPESPRVHAYPMEACIAEKCHAMIEHGFENSRMKDFYDVWFLASKSEFSFGNLSEAIRRTLGERGTGFPEPDLVAFSESFATHPLKLSQWSGFLKRTRLEGKAPSFPDACAVVRACRRPVLVPTGARPAEWTPGQGWSS